MVDNNENIYVDFDCANIIMVDPNKVVTSDGEVKERYVKQENLVMYANLECNVLPRTKLLIGTDKSMVGETISVAKVNFLKPGDKNFMDNAYTDELTGKGSVKGKAVNQRFVDTNTGDNVAGSFGVKGDIVDNGLLGITNISITQGLDFLPVITLELTDIKGRAMFELGNQSPYAAFFNLPYPLFHLTIKGYYGKAVKLALMLQNFSSRYDTSDGNFKITLKFYTYKYTMLSEINMGMVMAVPHMYKSRLNIQSQSGGPSQFTNVNSLVVERGYQKVKEMYNEYKSKGLIDDDFPEITLVQMRDRIEYFIKNILDSFTKKNLNPLTDVDDYISDISKYRTSICYYNPSWFYSYIDTTNYLVLKDTKVKVYPFKKEIYENIEKKNEAVNSLKNIIKEYNEKLSKNNTLGDNGKKAIPNSINYNLFIADVNESDIDFSETYRELKKSKEIPNFASEQWKEFKNELKKNNLLNFVDITLPNGGKISKTDYFVFEGKKSFMSLINDMEKKLKVNKEEIQNELSDELSDLIKSKENGIGFVPTIRNVLAVVFANAEAFLRLMDDVHTNAYDVRDDSDRISAVKTSISAVSGQDNIQGVPVFPWPQFIVETDGKNGHEKYELEYPGDAKYITQTKGDRFDIWPEIEFLEEFIKGFTERTTVPDSTTEGNNEYTETKRLSLSAIEFPVGNNVFSNKEEVKYFYEIYERLFLHSNYELLTRVINDSPQNIDVIIESVGEIESNNVITSLSNDNPFLIKKIKEYGFNSGNFVNYLKAASNFGTGESWQKYIRGIFVTPYLNNITNNSQFDYILENEILSSKTQPMTSFNNEEKIINFIAETQNNFSVIDTFPFTDVENWGKQYLSNGLKIIDEKDLFNTNKTLTFNKSKKVISNFLDTDGKNDKKPFSNFITDNITIPSVDYNNIESFYTDRPYNKQFITEGNLNYGDYDGYLVSKQTTSMLNTPFFINSIQDGVKKFRQNNQHPYKSSAFLFLNSLPISTLKEKFLTNNSGVYSELDYIASTLKKYGALHKLPYSFILKYGSIWHRYKTYIETNVDILDDVWKDFNYVENYDPTTLNPDKQYKLKVNNQDVDILLEKNTVIGGDTNTVMHSGFYPKLIDDFNLFCQGYEIFGNYTPTDIYDGFSSGLTVNYNSDSVIQFGKSFDPNNINRTIKVVPWNVTVNSLDGVSTFVFPSEGTLVNQVYNECFKFSILKKEVYQNKSLFNGSVRLFWAAPNYGYFDLGKIKKPTPLEYFKFVTNKTSEQENFSLNGGSLVYSDISEILSVFDKDILDSFENEFLTFSKSVYDYGKSDIVDLTEGESSFCNFQMLFREMVKLPKIPTNENTKDYIKVVQENQVKQLTNILDKFINKNVYFKYGNPSGFDKKLFYAFSQLSITDPYKWKPYTVGTPNALPYQNGLITLQSSKVNHPNAWKALQLYVGFSTINGLKYSNNGSYITDFFIDNNIEFTEDNVKLYYPIIKIYATQKLKNKTLNSLKFIDIIQEYLETNIGFQNHCLDNMIIKVQKQLPNVNNQPESNGMSNLNGPKSKRELWESFKAINDKWIAGADFKNKTLFEDVLLIDRASRNIGDEIIVDIYRLKSLLFNIHSNVEISVLVFIRTIIEDNNFYIMNLPSYVNFYNVQDVVKNPKPKPDGSNDFANNMFGTFLNVDVRQSSPKLICMYGGKTSEMLAMDTDLTKRKNDGFDLQCGGNNPLFEDIIDKNDHALSNRVAGFNVEIGSQNQSIFTSFRVDQNNSLSTAESLQIINDMANQAGNVKGATQGVSLYNLYKIRSYTCSLSMMGNAMVQPTMYFNLKYVPMYSGTYMITKVSHTITPGGFETIVDGVRQSITSISKVDDYLQTLKTNLLNSIIEKNKQEKVEKEKATKNSKNNVISEKDKVMANINGGKTLSTTCQTSSPYDKFVINTTPEINFSNYTTVKKTINDVLLTNNVIDDGKLKYVIFASMYVQSNTDNGFKAYENNYVNIDLGNSWGISITPYIKQNYYCLTNQQNTLPYAQFKDLFNHIEFLVKRWRSRMLNVTVDEKSIAKFWIENLSSERLKENVYTTFDKTMLSNLELKIKKSIEVYNGTN